jgi:hypothetical protein
MTLIDEEDHLEFLEKCGFTNDYGPDDSTIIFRVTLRGKSKDLEVTNEEIEALQRIGKIVHITTAIGQEGEEEEKNKPYISIEVIRKKELDLRQPIKAQEKKGREEEHPEHISD